jgi:hypothetical protein
MNREYAATIPLQDILKNFGLMPVTKSDHQSFFTSPFDPQRVATGLVVDHRHNTWHDTATRSAGGPVELVQAWLLRQGYNASEDDVLHWLRFNISYPSLVVAFDLSDSSEHGTHELVSKTGLRDRALIRYAMRQGIGYEQAKRMFNQVHVRYTVTGSEFLALGYRNEDGGYALYNPYVTGTTQTAAISFIRGREHKPDGVHVFKTIFDYCAVVRSRGDTPFDQDSIILHDFACADDAATYIRAYGYKQLYSWFAGDEYGRRATEAFDWLCATEPDLKHRAMSNDL